MGRKGSVGVKILSLISLVMALFYMIDLYRFGNFFKFVAFFSSSLMFISAINIYRLKKWARILLLYSSSYLLVYYSIALFRIAKYYLNSPLFQDPIRVVLSYCGLVIFYLSIFIADIIFFTRRTTREQFR